jgi:hypothetical protein
MFWRFLMMTWALSLIPIMAISVRILFTATTSSSSSHDHRWSCAVSSRKQRSRISMPSPKARVFRVRNIGNVIASQPHSG